MADFFWFSDAQWTRIAPLLPTDVRGMWRVDDRRVLSGIVHAFRSGGRWADCADGGPKTRLKRASIRQMLGQRQSRKLSNSARTPIASAILRMSFSSSLRFGPRITMPQLAP